MQQSTGPFQCSNQHKDAFVGVGTSLMILYMKKRSFDQTV